MHSQCEPPRVSTQTFTTKTNLTFTSPLDYIFERLTIDESIQIIKFKKDIKGYVPRKPRGSNSNNTSKNFLNCITLVVLLDKKINVKMFKNGVFQITGCRRLDHAKESVFKVVHRLIALDVIEQRLEEIVFYFKSAMRNADFQIGYNIDREQLAEQLYLNTDLNIAPITYSNMGVKIKLPISLEILPIYVMKFEDFPAHSEARYEEWRGASTRKRHKVANFVNITVFQNGKVTISCPDQIYQDQYYEWFLDLISNVKPYVEKKVEKKSFFK